MKKLVLLICLVLNAGAMAQTELELARRLLAVPGSTIQLYPGTLPPGFPAEVVLPPGKLIGSAVQERLTQIIYDTEPNVQTVLDGLGQALLSRGWRMINQGNRNQWGFSPGSFPSFASLCQEQAGLTLSVTTVTQGQSGELRMYLSRGRCANISRPFAEPPLPLLTPPKETQTSDVRGGGGNDEFFSQATLTTQVSGMDLLAHYAKQIEAAGWKQLQAAQPGMLSTSLWSKDNWIAVLTLLIDEQRFPNQRLIRITAFQR